MVLTRAPGDVGVFRSVDRRCGDAYADHHGTDDHSLYRHQPARCRLLHGQAAQVRDRHILFWISVAVGSNDHYRDLHPRPWVAMVLAGTNLGPQPLDL